ncbi:DeoR/GlpR family DNA-binding transcription regulator [Streptomyces sp. DSM 41527]|uniref:Lactose phosphotransferase system repressor n=1 Tax=Streptomyces mooreae TaxID=3075523 RepID=A0ABU2TD86_9ACTN|nr:DeoR/GlpR family DNA-binding transcription regulator [Streptomyces sp. DSM 41527]MDT0458917.1 DeoR/GlpR family DNA-binding transcription regulator [Streptomyces sp. DSM 41527]
MPNKARSSHATIERRRQDILRYVVEHGDIRIDELADHFHVSLMTMHRDLDDLAGRHLLRKKRGRAAAFPALTMETATRFREGENLPAKKAICATAAAWIQPGNTVVMDDSTTLFPLAGHLTGIEQLTVVTNSVGIAQLLGSAPNVTVTLLGGQYHGEFNSCTGPEVARGLSRIQADLALMSATAVCEGRLSHPLREYADVKESMIACSDRALLLADHSKFGKTATHTFGAISSYETVITDSATPESEIAAIRNLGVPVEVIEPTG